MKKKVAIVAGGYSGEFEISIKSAGVVISNIDKIKFDAYLVYILKEKWVAVNSAGKEVLIDKNDFSFMDGRKKIVFDVIFVAIHGTPGEDGKLQAYFDLLNIPYTTCDNVISAFTFNKNLCERLANSYGVKTAKSVHFYKRDKIDAAKITEKIKLPFFVKPNSGGSSIGMTRVTKVSELTKAIRNAFKEDDEILVSEYIKGIEITCGVMRYKEEMIVFPITEVVSKKAFFDYEAKYTQGMSEEITPARIPEEIEKKCKLLSCMIYNKFNCKGVVRMDYIVSRNELYFLEVNTVPGLSEASIIPKQAAEFGIPIKKLFSMMIEDAIFRSKKS
jgi:D-alanine-D-alanine ligase